jgi:gliding motility-associated-like protein
MTDSSVTFTISRLNGIDSVKWDFGDGQKSQLLQPVKKYTAAGFYNVQLIVYKVDCSGLNDTIAKRIWVAGAADFLGKDTSSCDILSLQFGIDEINGANYLWNTGAVSNRINTSVTGLFWLEIEQKGCTIRDSVTVSAKPLPFVKIAAQDTTVCGNRPIVLSVGNTNATAYLWNTGETTSSITIDKTGKYFVTVTKNTCIASDTLRVTSGDCEMFIPNAFTPNKDGLNDNFGVLGTAVVQDFSFKIYNRYGQVIFSTNNIANKWDGTYKGQRMSAGTYPWSIIYINKLGYTKWLRGTVLIVR